MTVEQLIQMQQECRADATLFVDADRFGEQFRRIAAGDAPRLRGRTCAIFSKTSEWCPGEDAYTGARTPWIGPTFRSTLGRLKRAWFDRRKSVRYFYEHVLVGRRAVDVLIVKDERIVQRYGAPVCWMPEIYRVFDVRPEERKRPDWEKFAGPIRQYVTQAGPDNVLLYFGSAALYKGYDQFLQLVQADESTVGLHAGPLEGATVERSYCESFGAARRELKKQGRLFETNAFIESEDLVSLLFGSVARFVSTHRLTLSSGTLLQALEAGKAVLTPDAGLVGWRTREFKLGGTYAYGNGMDLAEKWLAFKSGALDPAKADIRSFMDKFSRERTAQFFTDILTGSIA